MSKKAVFIGPAYPYRGGIAAFNENLATVFQKNGWDCKIFTFMQQYPNILFPGKDQMAPGEDKPDLSIERAIYSMNPLNWLKISKQIIKEEPDIIITQYWMPFMAPAFGTILRGIKKGLPEAKCITIVHNFKPHESRIGDKQLNKFIANRTDMMVSLSPSDKEDILSSLPNMHTISLFHPIYDHYGKAVDKKEAMAKLDLDPAFKHLLFFGLVRQYKGLDVLIDALPLIKSTTPFKVIIAGEFYQDESKYRKQIEELGLEDKILIRNEYIPNEEVPYYFCGSDVVVLPYKTATQSGVVPIAIHFGKPVIVTNVGSLNSLLKKHQIGLVSEPDKESLAQSLNSYLNNETQFNNDFSEIRQELSWQSFFDNFIKELDIQ
ncbi:MAG: glycosyltransferase [Saprospiraceae bacterium]|nr:glycosyltransferase [Saprospiraceae bacterium]